MPNIPKEQGEGDEYPFRYLDWKESLMTGSDIEADCRQPQCCVCTIVIVKWVIGKAGNRFLLHDSLFCRPP